MTRDGLYRELERVLSQRFGGDVEIQGERLAGGGCINNAQRIETDRGAFFLKYNPSPLPGMFAAEAEGLQALHAAGKILVPEPIAHSEGGPDFPPYILMTCFDTGTPGGDFFERFGRRFAELHRDATAERFGFPHDNYCGSTPQPNGWMDDWVDFFRERRLGFQLRLAQENGFGGALQKNGERLLERLGDLIAEPADPPSLLHGDLWVGNFLCTPANEPVLIDPAAYYGRREADLAMTMLFGGYPQSFYRAYEEVWPLESGSRDRLEIYKLYHLLNHLNLFGGGYLGSCLGIIERYGA